MDAFGADASVEQIRDRYQVSIANAKAWQEVISQEEVTFETWLLQSYPPLTGPFAKPRFWRSLTWGSPAQPLVGVCWYEALAYYPWLNALLDCNHYRLASEAEWEAADRGRGKWRRHTWEGEFDPLKANTAETRLGVTTPIGVFTAGVTPDTGLLDLRGNVWEWTTTPWSEGETWKPSLAPDAGAPEVRRVVRGGSWGATRAVARLGARLHPAPDDLYAGLGFRLCRGAHISTRLLGPSAMSAGGERKGSPDTLGLPKMRPGQGLALRRSRFKWRGRVPSARSWLRQA